MNLKMNIIIINNALNRLMNIWLINDFFR
jgi:hypothetical protein